MKAKTDNKNRFVIILLSGRPSAPFEMMFVPTDGGGYNSVPRKTSNAIVK